MLILFMKSFCVVVKKQASVRYKTQDECDSLLNAYRQIGDGRVNTCTVLVIAPVCTCVTWHTAGFSIYVYIILYCYCIV